MIGYFYISDRSGEVEVIKVGIAIGFFLAGWMIPLGGILDVPNICTFLNTPEYIVAISLQVTSLCCIIVTIVLFMKFTKNYRTMNVLFANNE